MTDKIAYKILGAEDWVVAEKAGYPSTPLDMGDGYVHLSTKAQVGQTLALHYKNASYVRLLEFALVDLSGAGEIKWEPSRGGELFPHLYGQLPIAAALRLWVLANDANGVPILPEDI